MPPRSPCFSTYTGPDLPPSTAHFVPIRATPCEPRPTSPWLFAAQSVGATSRPPSRSRPARARSSVWSYASPGNAAPFADTTSRCPAAFTVGTVRVPDAAAPPGRRAVEDDVAAAAEGDAHDPALYLPQSPACAPYGRQTRFSRDREGAALLYVPGVHAGKVDAHAPCHATERGVRVYGAWRTDPPRSAARRHGSWSGVVDRRAGDAEQNDVAACRSSAATAIRDCAAIPAGSD